MAASNRADWLIPSGLIALAIIPVVAGWVRLGLLAGGGPITPDNARFFGAPVAVVLHIVSVTIYSLLGAFQFAPGFRRSRPDGHRAAGRVLVVAGLAAATSGLWMAVFYVIVPADSALLHGFRLFFGSAMALSIVLGYLAIRRRDVTRHQEWMRRAYALGMGAGTQALTQLPPLLLFGPPGELTLALMMGAAWVVNMAVAEWLIHRERVAAKRAVATRPPRTTSSERSLASADVVAAPKRAGGPAKSAVPQSTAGQQIGCLKHQAELNAQHDADHWRCSGTTQVGQSKQKTGVCERPCCAK